MIEYKVRAVTRYVVTRFELKDKSGGSSPKGEFDNYEYAYSVGCALAKYEADNGVDDNVIPPEYEPDMVSSF